MKHNEFENFQKNYSEIEIPEELKRVVELAVEDAKEEEKMVKHRSINGWIKATGTVVAACACMVIAVNSSATIANTMAKIPVIGSVIKVVTFRTYEVDEERVQANIEVPSISVEPLIGGGVEQDIDETKDVVDVTETFNRTVEDYTNELIVAFENDIAQMEEDGMEGCEAIDTRYEVITDTDNLFSLRMDTTLTEASGYNFSKVYHIDKVKNEMITLEDVFIEDSDYVTIISENIKDQMRYNMANDENVLYFIDSEEGFDQFDFKQIKADQNFYFNVDGDLTIMFDEYEVAAGYMGMLEFIIPSNILVDILAFRVL